MLRRATRSLLAHPLLIHAASLLTRGVAPVFMMHRFRDLEAGNAGLDPEVLRADLSWLRSNKFSVLPLKLLLDRLAEGATIKRTVAFTVDDGYADFASIAAPIFLEFDCPVTVFLSTRFIDGRDWMWWDKVAVALKTLGREADRRATVAELKLIPESEKLARIDKLIRESDQELPSIPPPQFGSIAWDDVRRLARRGFTFGAHSVTHAVLSRLDAERSHFEIAESWRRVRAEAGDGAVPVFCYPNGVKGDFGVREETAVAAEGLLAGLAAYAGYTSPIDFSLDRPSMRFRLPRFSYSGDRAEFRQVASGVERGKMVIRALTGRWPLRP